MRLDVNPLRIFDSKDEGDQEIVAGAPAITDHLCDECAAHFAGVRAFLDARGVAYRVTPGMVRGLDYYERTAWEWVIPGGGAQAGTISGGGRYDGLAEQIGGERVPGVGFGCGIERVVLALEDAGIEAPRRWSTGSAPARTPPRGRRCMRCSSRLARAGSRVRRISPAAASRASCATPSGCGARVVTVCRAGDGERGIVRHGEQRDRVRRSRRLRRAERARAVSAYGTCSAASRAPATRAAS